MAEEAVTTVLDPFGARNDPSMPFLAGALDPQKAHEQIAKLWAGTRGPESFCLRSIKVCRHKAGRRCLIEYALRTESDGTSSHVVLIGKVRARRTDRATNDLLRELWRCGFDAESKDRISVPEPVGTIPSFHMVLQLKVSALSATEVLVAADGATLARRVAEAAHKLHQTDLRPSRRHGIADELAILHQRLGQLAQVKPEWANRLERILVACDRLGTRLSPLRVCGIHRDFYSEHVLVDQSARLWLLDFDLYCQGDPALDIGNFIAHLTEQSLRTRSDPTAFQLQEQALEDRFVELNGQAARPAVQGYALLTLVRHIAISRLFPDRQPYTEKLMDLCEERFAIISLL